ncbi:MULTISPECIES: YggT family protein [Kurthia]|uniref:YggT family protein n=1 Tax=Kurthia TaxID=1649 RepID=UPI001144A7E7|nr:YggT family protein [Kurthia gibsonii]GED18585.1 membrane protein [Kurthia gibsonii]
MLINVINIAFEIYFYVIIAYVLMSWLPALQESTFGQVIGKIVEPYLEIFRKIIPPIGMIDISPIVAIIALNFIQLGVIKVLFYLMY